ncbi:hypothetical protein ABFS83_12G006900 [Erythranthe nasuta]
MNANFLHFRAHSFTVLLLEAINCLLLIECVACSKNKRASCLRKMRSEIVRTEINYYLHKAT